MFDYSLHPQLQLNKDGSLKHFITLEGLNARILTQIMDQAQTFLDHATAGHTQFDILKNKTIANLFFEPSTRTRTTFELAAKRLGAHVININIQTSSATKGESLLDTLHNLQAMHCDMFIVRHESSGAAHFIVRHIHPGAVVINGGDGQHAHPSQALLDMLTIRQHKKAFDHLSVAIVGDIAHSRVARSQLLALNLLGVPDIRVIAPLTLLPAHINEFGVKVLHDLAEGLQDVDVVIMLRLQKERMHHGLIPSEQEYFHLYGLTPQKLGYAKPDAIVLHPGPINRGVEIASTVVDGPQSVILQQVSNGIVIRMAIMMMTCLNNHASKYTI